MIQNAKIYLNFWVSSSNDSNETSCAEMHLDPVVMILRYCFEVTWF